MKLPLTEENHLKLIHLKKHLYIILLVTSLAIIAGCGGGSTSQGASAKSPSLSAGPVSQDGTVTIHGANMDGVAVINFSIGYPGKYGPHVSDGALISGASTTLSSQTDGVLDISIARATPFTGSGPVLELSFDAWSADMKVTINSVTMLDVNGHPL